jgi:threonine synthase
MVDGMLTIGACEGVSAAPESGATFAALTMLVESGSIKPHDRVVLLSTGGALKYLDALPA